jgi:hypothetical protein
MQLRPLSSIYSWAPIVILWGWACDAALCVLACKMHCLALLTKAKTRGSCLQLAAAAMAGIRGDVERMSLESIIVK